ncbi:cobalt ECF transporter T component CbiQ [Candidatus Bathycorpusculum sp.]|uniref:cobalt ECF transporter T component CbiQ n=1 Tax=Candidatus Bathycorpusculum sp. TaxID=2994959 RepID=UPI0028292E47|nr:cobalt ECF transporter T component CbiQ [Candidatus Termitimicrobium sp.]MCL2430937.1 cobalt ECF transporter T component CbiQ [Candidatus Termitimicrobium sp.]
MSHSELYVEIDRSAYTNALSKSSPITKTFFALSALIICVSVQTFIVPVVVFIICTILILGLAKVRARLYFNLFVYPTYMLALSCIFLALFFGSGANLIEISLPWFTWSIFKSGLIMSITTFLRVEGALSCLFFLVLTTSITDLCVLLRRIHMPQVMVELSMMIYRYIFVFLEISEQMSLAQTLRLRRSGWLNRIRALSMLIGSLFIRTLDQGERTLAAMNARGYDGDIRILEDFASPKKLVLLGIVIFDVLLVILLFLTLNIGVI